MDRKSIGVQVLEDRHPSASTYRDAADYCARVSQDGKSVVACSHVSTGVDQSVRVWDLTTGELTRSLNNHTLPAHDLALRPNDTGLPMVASVSDDRTVRLWQPTIGRMVKFARLKETPLNVAWFNDGSRIVAACADGVVRLVDPDSVEVTGEIHALNSWAYSLAVHPTDRSIVVGGPNVQVRRIVPE